MNEFSNESQFPSNNGHENPTRLRRDLNASNLTFEDEESVNYQVPTITTSSRNGNGNGPHSPHTGYF